MKYIKAIVCTPHIEIGISHYFALIFHINFKKLVILQNTREYDTINNAITVVIMMPWYLLNSITFHSKISI